MPQLRFAADAFGVVTIFLVALLILLGIACIAYSIYFRSRVRSQGFIQLSFFSGPWIIRLSLVLFVILWGLGEVLRLSLLRRKGSALNSLNSRWQETVCKGYIVSSLGFAEPCLFLTLVFLLRAPLQRIESGALSRNWNAKTAAFVIMFCSPVFVLQLLLILVDQRKEISLPLYFSRAATHSSQNALCTYPLLNTILLGLFTTILTGYLLWLGRRILTLVINRSLQKRVYISILSVSGLIPLRVLLLGLSVLSEPDKLPFEATAFLAFLSLYCCAGVCICTLVYYPVADALSLGSFRDAEGRGGGGGDDHLVSLVGDETNGGGIGGASPESNSDASTKRGSISFRAYDRDGTSASSLVELSFFSPSHGSTAQWPMRLPPETQGQHLPF